VTEPLLIVGAGGFAREAAQAVADLNAIEPRWDLLGFVDDDPSIEGKTLEGLPVLGRPEVVLASRRTARVIVCTGRPDNYFSRRRIVERLNLPVRRYATIIHPAASIPPAAEIGCGTVILAGVIVTTRARIGSHVAVMPACVITHDDVVGNFATLASGVRLGGSVSVAEGAYLGAGSLVREGLRIGAWSLVGMGSVVLRDVPAGQIWFGSPAVYRGEVTVPFVMDSTD
jgi:sugar O-acyltransferase (sialic acid O-acetyltransferase NeuD family)